MGVPEDLPTELGASARVLGLPPEEVDRYNSQLEDFFERYKRYVEADWKFRQYRSLTVGLELLVVNEGTAPADDLDVYLHFPDGFLLFEEQVMPEPPHDLPRHVNPGLDWSSFLPYRTFR